MSIVPNGTKGRLLPLCLKVTGLRREWTSHHVLMRTMDIYTALKVTLDRTINHMDTSLIKCSLKNRPTMQAFVELFNKTQYAFVVHKLISMAYGHTEGGLTKRLCPLGPLALECVCVIYGRAIVSHKLYRLLLANY